MTLMSRLGAAAFGLTAVTLLVGCGGDDSAAPATPTTSATDSGAKARNSDVLAEQTVALADDPEDRVRIGVQSLTVEGPTMVLRLLVTPQFASASPDEPVTLGDAVGVGGEFFGVDLRLLDRDNLKEYSVVHEGNRWWATSSGEVSSPNGQPMSAFAVFAAPEDDIDSIDVRVDEQWPEFPDVPITR